MKRTAALKRDVTAPPASSETVSPYQKGWLGVRRGWWILLTLGIGSTAGTMNNTIVNTTLPVIRESFNASLSLVEWVLMSYLLTISILLLSSGRLGDIWGHKRVYITGLLVFVVASGLCSLSPTEGFLIAARALQAVGGAMMIANSSAIISRSFPPEQRGQLLGLLYTVASFGTLAGPSIGGFMTDAFGWRSIFYLNMVIGLAGAAASWRVLADTGKGEKRERFDVVGALVLATGLACLLLAITKGQETGWTSPPILGLIAVSVVLLFFFFRVEHRTAHPMIDTTLFRSRVFSFAMLSAFVAYMCAFAGMFLTPFYLMQVREFPASLAGQLYSAQPVGMIITTPISGYLSDRIRPQYLAALGALIVGAGLFIFRGLSLQAGEPEILVALFVLGMGNGIFIGPNASIVMGASPPERQGVASGVVATARNLGMVFGIAAAGAILALQTVQRVAEGAGGQVALLGAYQDTFLVMSLLALVGAAAAMVRREKLGSRV